MKQYIDLLKRVHNEGTQRDDRTGTGTRAIFGPQLEFDLRKGFPAVTTKKLWLKGVWVELIWMISGKTNIEYLREHNVKIWEEWASESGELGPVYGSQWRNFNGVGIDQLADSIHKIKTAPTDRRMLVSAWNPAQLHLQALPPCHLLYQFFVDGEWLDIKVYQRSADMFLGVPFDIASYATLLHMVAQVTGKKPRMLYYSFGDTHIYNNHFMQVEEQLKREPLKLPTLHLNPAIKNIDDFKLEDISLVGYEHHPALTGKVSK